jgi:hypothetical protein
MATRTRPTRTAAGRTTGTDPRTRAGRTGRADDRRHPARIASLVVGILFLAVGAAGFIPGVTTDYGDMTFAGQESGAMLFGLFQVSILHNIVHLLFGLVGIAAATRVPAARHFLLWGGVAYLALWIYGMAIDHGSDANFLPVNTADDWLHFGLGAGMVVLAALTWRRRDVDLHSSDNRR